MSRAVVFIALVALVAAVSGQQWGEVRFIPSNGNSGISGWAYFSTTGSNTSVTVVITGLTAYTSRGLGIHIHEWADMVTLANADTFDPGNKTFGTHWRGRGNVTFGCPETNTFPNYRAGCLGNWQVDANGVINQTKYFPAEQLSNGAATLNELPIPEASPIGFGMILHANTDPCNGNSTLYGARIAGGVIGISNPATVNTRAFVDTTTITATCRLFGTNGNSSYSGIRGSVWFRQTTSGSISVRAIINNFPGGLGAGRSMHVHVFGDLTDQLEGLSTGGHWNPTGSDHSLPPAEPRHAGDLGRITITNNASALFYNYILSSTDLNNPNTIYHPQLGGPASILGRGLILHAGIDVGCQGATTNGNAGARAAQCVIGRARNEVWDELLANWNTLAPTAAQSIVPQPGDICSAPRAAPPPGQAAASGVVVSFGFVLLAAIAALLF